MIISVSRIVVIKDASFSDKEQLAGLGVITPWGHYSRIVETSSSTMAENAALVYAMQLAANALKHEVDFWTDRDPTERDQEVVGHLVMYREWRIVSVHRGKVHPAHRLARNTLRLELGR